MSSKKEIMERVFRARMIFSQSMLSIQIDCEKTGHEWQEVEDENQYWPRFYCKFCCVPKGEP